MIKVNFYGTTREKVGTNCLMLEAKSINDLNHKIPGLSYKEASNLVTFVNGKKVSKFKRLKDGDEVSYLSPAGGG